MKAPETKYTTRPGTLDEPNRLYGYAARFDEESQILFDKNVCNVPFVEVIKPGAFAKTLRENGDIRALFSHDKAAVLGRTKAGTLTLYEDDQGLYFDNTLPDTTIARDLRVSLLRGDMDGCSFFGYVIEDEIEMRPGQPALRTIHEISLIEITPATAFPAYETATVALRSQFPQYFQGQAEPDVEAGVMVACFLPPEVASSLAIEGGEPADQLHVTLCYLGQASEVGTDRLIQLDMVLAQVACCFGPLVGSIGGTGRFPASISSDGMGVLYAGVDVPGLIELRQAVAQGLLSAGFRYKQNHGYTPHVTLAYVEPSSPMLYVLESRPVKFASIDLAVGPVRKTFPLSALPSGYPLGLAGAQLMLSCVDD